MTTTRPTAPLVSFYRIVEEARLPQRADRSAAGTLPTRASRYCDAVTLASAFGWHVYAPMDFTLLWDGADIFWSYDATPAWLPLETAQFPNLRQRFDTAAPEHLRGCAPPFLTALAEPGVVQVWTGLFACSAPGWSLLVRPPANLPLPGGYTTYEGIVETDHWFGPLFTNLRLTRTDTPVRIRADFPLLQVQPLPRQALCEDLLSTMSVIADPASLQDADWDAYYESVVRPNDDPNRPVGQYAIAARRRRKSGCPYAVAALA
jgi:Family of unknown function (DUF6065)